MSSRQGGRNAGYGLYLIPGVLASLAVIVVPLIMTVGVSFTKWNGIGEAKWIGVDNYTRLFADDLFWASFGHILLLIVAMAIIPTFFGLVMAAVLFDYVAKVLGERWAKLFRSGFYLPQVLPVAVTGIIWVWILHPSFGALNRILDTVGLGSLSRDWLGNPDYALFSVMGVMIWFQFGYPIVMFMSGLQRVDPELYEAAALDGAGWWSRFRHITVRMIRPELYVVLVTTTIAALKIFGQVFVLTGGGPSNATLVPSYFAYKNFFEKAQVGYGSAISTVLTVMIVILAIVFLRLQNRQESRS
ncbi:carbohydrate ABC transporter permease [Actinoplanes sp. NPDC051494]|uniref:carbohydrate ABC transporter permease n=1 Tax=Actinoplanes sp. NPDC051494 TaxID=3363907 RepID=UPI0037B95CB0